MGAYADFHRRSIEDRETFWAEEAQRRDAEMDVNPGSSCSAAEVFREARAKLK